MKKTILGLAIFASFSHVNAQQITANANAAADAMQAAMAKSISYNAPSHFDTSKDFGVSRDNTGTISVVGTNSFHSTMSSNPTTLQDWKAYYQGVANTQWAGAKSYVDLVKTASEGYNALLANDIVVPTKFAYLQTPQVKNYIDANFNAKLKTAADLIPTEFKGTAAQDSLRADRIVTASGTMIDTYVAGDSLKK